MIRAQVIVRPRASIFDPQGDAVCRAIQHLGVSAVKQAHVGKCIELELEDGDLAKTRLQLETICKDLLSNPVIEDYVLTFNGAGATKVKVLPKPAAKKATPIRSVKKPTAKAKPAKKLAAKPVTKPKKPIRAVKKAAKPARRKTTGKKR